MQIFKNLKTVIFKSLVYFGSLFNFSNQNKSFIANSSLFKREYLWEHYYNQCVLVCFWLIGWCNPVPFVIMLSAAHDFLKEDSQTSLKSSVKNKFDCNQLSTGIILLADILPSIFIKFIATFFVDKISYNIRVIFVILFSTTSFLLVAYANKSYFTIIGVMFASASSGFGEITFLSLSTLYHTKLSLSGWASGTGMSGLIGSFIYAFLTTFGLSPRDTILVMLCVPVIMLLAYYILPPENYEKNNDDEFITENYEIQHNGLVKNIEIEKINVYEKIILVKPLIKYMIPLFLVYFSEFFINQGLFELIYFGDGLIKDHKQQYR